MSVPLVASPDIEACSPAKSHGAYQSRGSRTRSAVSMMMKMVEPYISIMSPVSSTPTLSASAAASMVPTMTGVPSARPVSSRRLARDRRRRCRSSRRARGRRSSSMMSARELVAPVQLVDDVERREIRGACSGR